MWIFFGVDFFRGRLFLGVELFPEPCTNLLDIFGELSISSDLASRIEADNNITRDEVFHVIKHIYDLNLQWKAEEVLGAWERTRGAKNDKCSVQSREKVFRLL